MRFLSVCSGIEAASCAWLPLGWECAAVAEVDPFACAVLAHHYPGVPNLGDITKFRRWPNVGPVDLLVGGTPCQSFSVAGLRKGLADPRGNLALTFLAIADRLRPRWVVWENVPGVLSVDKGQTFGAFLGGLGQLGYGFAYRVLDAQHFGIPQRRRRVFVVGYLGDWRRAAAVLFERACLSRDPPPRREEGKDPAARAPLSTPLGLGDDGGTARALNGCRTASGRHDVSVDTFVSHSLRAEGSDASKDGAGRGTPIIAETLRQHPRPGSSAIGATIAIQDTRAVRDKAQNGIGISEGGPMYTVDSTSRHGVLAFDPTQITHPANHSAPAPGDPSPPLARAAHPMAVAFTSKDSGADAGELAPTLRAGQHLGGNANGGAAPAVAFDPQGSGKQTTLGASSEGVGALGATKTPAVAFQTSQSGTRETDAHATLDSNNGSGRHNGVAQGATVRRLTPRECERLQGFSDDYTAIPYRGKPACDGPRYRALGNSMAVPVMAWIGRRIALVEDLCR